MPNNNEYNIKEERILLNEKGEHLVGGGKGLVCEHKI